MRIDSEVRRLLDEIGYNPYLEVPDLPINEGLMRVRQSAPLPERARLAARSEDREIEGPAGAIRVRIYWPEGAGPFPILMNFHGGGWVTGSIEKDDLLCQRLTVQTGCITISVDYRLAPEHVFPAGLDDCYAATCWAVENAAEIVGDGQRIAVAGSSSGGNLAAAVAIRARDEDRIRPLLQLLFYPVIDGAADPELELEGGPYFLTRRNMEWYWAIYVSDPAQRLQPLVSPRHLIDKSGLPPALIITAELDPLADEARIYAQELRAAGVPASYVEVPEIIHGFLNSLPDLRQTMSTIDIAAASLRDAFAIAR